MICNIRILSTNPKQPLQENLIHGLYAGQEVRSHVWLCPVGDLWQVANFSHKTSPDRSQWRRSQSVVSGVRIVEQPNGLDDSDAWNPWSMVHSRGLPTDEGPSTVYVEFRHPDIEKEMVRQMVPVDFLPGEGGVGGWLEKTCYIWLLNECLSELNLTINSGIKACPSKCILSI